MSGGCCAPGAAAAPGGERKADGREPAASSVGAAGIVVSTCRHPCLPHCCCCCPPHCCRLKEVNAKCPQELKAYYECMDYYRCLHGGCLHGGCCAAHPQQGSKGPQAERPCWLPARVVGAPAAGCAAPMALLPGCPPALAPPRPAATSSQSAARNRPTLRPPAPSAERRRGPAAPAPARRLAPELLSSSPSLPSAMAVRCGRHV